MTTMIKNGIVKEVHDDNEVEKYSQLGWQVQTDSDSDNSKGDADGDD